MSSESKGDLNRLKTDLNRLAEEELFREARQAVARAEI